MTQNEARTEATRWCEGHDTYTVAHVLRRKDNKAEFRYCADDEWLTLRGEGWQYMETVGGQRKRSA